MRLRARLTDLRNITESGIRKRLPASLGGRCGASDLRSRSLRQGDALQVIDLLGVPPIKTNMDALSKQLSDPELVCIGLLARDRLIASAWVGPQWAFLGIGGTWIGGLLVRRGWRNRGIGKLTMARALGEATRRRWLPVHVNIRSDNTASIIVAEASGFRRVRKPEWKARIEEHVGTPQVIMTFGDDVFDPEV